MIIVKLKNKFSKLLLISLLAVYGISISYAQESDSVRLSQLEERTTKLEVLKGLKLSITSVSLLDDGNEAKWKAESFTRSG